MKCSYVSLAKTKKAKKYKLREERAWKGRRKRPKQRTFLVV